MISIWQTGREFLRRTRDPWNATPLIGEWCSVYFDPGREVRTTICIYVRVSEGVAVSPDWRTGATPCETGR